jgi:uncharacterized protein with NRDE domain
MCLIVVARNASARFPFVLAANREEDHTRATRFAHRWTDNARVVGGRDLRHGGSWLALREDGRFAAVTNVRGGEGRPDARSRGLLVRDFVLGDIPGDDYLRGVRESLDVYDGFHLVAGEVRGAVARMSSVGGPTRSLDDGYDTVTNAPPDESWPKSDAAIGKLHDVLGKHDDARVFANELLEILATPGEPSSRDPKRDLFVIGEQHGTRSSTVIVATSEGKVLFVEQNYDRSGHRTGPPIEFRFATSS